MVLEKAAVSLPHIPSKVIGLLVRLLFSEKGLSFDKSDSLDHVEAFAGEHSVTIGELQDSVRRKCSY